MSNSKQTQPTVTYHQAITQLLNQLETKAMLSIQAVAADVAACIETGGILYVFGAGHSSLLAEEAFHRAGGLVPVYPVLQSFLSPHISPLIAGRLERLEGISPVLFSRLGAQAGDMMFIASNSGVNAAGIEMALEAKKAGLKVVVVTSLTHSTAATSRHSSGKKLYQCADAVIDNQCPTGDALCDVGGMRVAPGSTMANAWIWNSIVVETCKRLHASGKTLPVYVSANMPGGDKFNEVLEKSYAKRIPLLS